MIKKIVEEKKIKEWIDIKDDYHRAYELVSYLFKDKKDKEGDPYLWHLVRVSNSLIEKDTKVAGLLHDIVEDIENVTFEDLVYLGFNKNIIELVRQVTKDYNSSKLSPEEKKRAYHQKITSILESNNLEAVKLKYADMKDNMNVDRLARLDEKTKEYLYNKYKDELVRLKTFLKERNCLYE